MVRARLGEFHRQLVEHFGDLVVDVFRAVVGMKSEYAEWEVLQQGCDDRQQIGFGDLLASGDQLPLGDAVDGVDMIDALAPS